MSGNLDALNTYERRGWNLSAPEHPGHRCELPKEECLHRPDIDRAVRVFDLGPRCGVEVRTEGTEEVVMLSIRRERPGSGPSAEHSLSRTSLAPAGAISLGDAQRWKSELFPLS